MPQFGAPGNNVLAAHKGFDIGRLIARLRSGHVIQDVQGGAEGSTVVKGAQHSTDSCGELFARM